MSTGLLLDGVFASEAIDSSGEILDIKGLDISDFEDGKGVANYEHKGHDGKDNGEEIIGKIVFAKKIFGASDCGNDRERMYWDRVKLPFLYGVVRFFDGAGHEGAKALAAIVRDTHANSEPILVEFSIEGSTLEHDKATNRLKSTVARRVALTLRPCNKTATSGLLADPNAPAGFEKDPVKPDLLAMVPVREGTEKSEHGDPRFTRLGGSSAIYGSDVLKALSAGGYGGAPGTLSGGSALQVEDQGLKKQKLKAMAMAAFRDWNRVTPFKKFLKARLPEASDEFLDHFNDIVDRHLFRVRKSVETVINLKKAGKLKSPKKAGVAATKPVKGPVQEEPLTVRGQALKPNPDLKSPRFDEETGTLHTPRGSFPMYIPSRDKNAPDAGKQFHAIMADPKINQFHDYAMDNWLRAHKLLKAGKIPEEVVMHGILFSQLSPNTPVPNQELMYCLDQDVILATCNRGLTKIKDCVAGDVVWGVDASGQTIKTRVVALHDHGIQNGFEIEFDDGYRVICSKNHKFLTQAGMQPLWFVVEKGLEILCDPNPEKRWMEDSLRSDLFDRGLHEGTPEGVRQVQGSVAPETLGECQGMAQKQSRNFSEGFGEGSGRCPQVESRTSGPSHGWDPQMGEGLSGRIFGSSGEGIFCHVKVASRQSGISSPPFQETRGLGKNLAGTESGTFYRELRESGTGSRSMASGTSAGICGDYGQFYCSRNEFFGAHISNREQSPVRVGLAVGADPMLFGQEEAGRPGQFGSQDLGGSRWVLALLSGERETGSFIETGVSPVPGCHAQGRSTQKAGCHPDQAGWGLLCESFKTTEAGMAGMAGRDAEKSSTRGLVLRKIVRIRALGQRRMYDLEVSHAEHNFLLPNGVVTSNSHLVDAMKFTGKDPRSSKDLDLLRQDWLNRDKPQTWPEHSRDHFRRLEDVLRIGNDSKLTGRKAGDIGGFMLANNKFKNMEKYHTLHQGLMELLGRHKADGRSAAEELMYHKQKAELHGSMRDRALAAGKPDPGEYSAGPSVPGLAPKTTRYTLGMIGAGNVQVPDTHFARYLFGLDKDQDGGKNGSIDYIKSLLWNPGNSHVLSGIDRYYAQHHDAVQHLLNHPRWGKEFSNPEDAVFPAFWKNWMAIIPHEKARGMTTGGFNEYTDHRPFWEAIAPHLQKSEGHDLAMQTAKQHAEWALQYGAMPAQMLYFRYLLPQLIEAGMKREALGLTRKFEAMSVELLSLSKGEFRPEPAPAQPPPETVTFQGKTIRPGRGYHKENGVDMSILHASPTEFVAVPTKKLSAWGPEDLIRSPRDESRIRVHTFPEDLSVKNRVDSKVHGVGEFIHHDDVHDLVHDYDFNQKQEPGPSNGVNSERSWWGRTAKGVRVYVKAANTAHPEQTRNEGAYHNLARDFFGMGQYLPRVGVVTHPGTGIEHAIVESVPGEHFHPRNKEHIRALGELGKSGEIDKLSLMNMVLGNLDRHGGNYLMTKDGGIKLIDHGLAFARSPMRPGLAPDYQYQHENHHVPFPAETPIHERARTWALGLDPTELGMQMRRHGLDEDKIQLATARLQHLRHHLSVRPDSPLGDALYLPSIHANVGTPVVEDKNDKETP